MLGNYIGTDVSGTLPLSNDRGVAIGRGASGNMVGGTDPGAGNVIAFNAEGVALTGSNTVRDSILGNSIFGNAGLGIDLDSPPANDGQPAPCLTSVSTSATGTTVKGTLKSAPGTCRCPPARW